MTFFKVLTKADDAEKEKKLFESEPVLRKMKKKTFVGQNFAKINK